MLPGLRDSQGRIIATTDAVPADAPFWRGVAVSPNSEIYIDAGSDPTKTLDIDFLSSGPLDSRITFTRTTTGTYLADDGLLKTAAVDVPRFEYDANGNALGLLIEGARTNLALHSQDFANPVWVKDGATVSAYAGLAPDGSLTAFRIQFSNDSGALVEQLYGSPDGAGKTYTGSVWLKSNTGESQALRLKNTHVAVVDNFLPITIVPEWERFTFSVTNGAAAGTGQFFAVSNSTDILAKDFLMWGVQLELGPSASSYIPTTTAAVTRAADSASMTGTNLSSWYDNDQGTWVAQVEYSQTGLKRGVAELQDVNIPLRVEADNRLSAYLTGALVSVVAAQPFLQIAKLASRYVGGAVAEVMACMNGVLGSANVPGSATLANTSVTIGNSSGDFLFGHLQRLVYFNRVLTDAEMVEITGGVRTRMYPTTIEGALQIEVDGTPEAYQSGIAYTADGRICAKLNAVPHTSDRYIAGVRVTPEGLVHFVTNVAPLQDGWSNGFSSGFGL